MFLLNPRKVNFDEIWTDLRSTAEDVMKSNKVERIAWSKSFYNVYSLCVADPEPFDDMLYEETKKLLKLHVENMLITRVNPPWGADALKEDEQPDLLQRYYDAWSEYSNGITHLHNLYSYLNQQQMKKPKTYDRMEIGELGLDIWRTKMCESLNYDLVKHILECFKSDRMGNPSLDDERLEIISGVMHSFVKVQAYSKTGSLKVYQSLFECPMLFAIGDYYATEAMALLQKSTVREYMEEVIKILHEENKRAPKFVHSSSLPKFLRQCEGKFINDHLDFIFSEWQQMVSQENRKDLSNMYIILKAIPDHSKVMRIQTFLDHIKNEALKIISTLEAENIHIQFVEGMLKVHQKYTQLIAEVFENDPMFLSALDKACASVINHRPSDKQPCRSAEHLAKYCDTLLKKSKTPQVELDQKLTNNIKIFKYIEDKDIYQKGYTRLLAKRLMHEQSQSMDAEEAMINLLKQACGHEFTNKLHRMFMDIRLSPDLNNKFNNYLKEESIDLDINVSFQVLHADAWPLAPTQDVIPVVWPENFEKAIGPFEKFYHNSFSSRKLTWQHHMSHGKLKLCYLKQTYIVTMPTYQMAMLLLFESCDAITCKDIQNTLQLNGETFQKYMQSLLKSKILLTSSENLDDNAKIELNLDYTNKRTKFKILASILQKETPQEVKHTMKAVDEDRQLYLRAAIVRILKTRKVLKHNALIQEILSQSNVNFTPSITSIKKCIESLIDGRYIERTPNSGDEYSYVP